MEININNTNTFIFNKICLLFGQNSSNKSKILNTIKENIQNNNIKINGNNIEKNDYNILYFDEETDFNKEFKFTKNNIYKTTIYDTIIKSIDQQELLQQVNDIFNAIDNKVNKYINNESSTLNDHHLTFNISINDINKIIEKFTNIYFDDYLLTNDNISKRLKRKLIYELIFMYLKNQQNNTFVIIDNFDVYLDDLETIEIINIIKKYSEITNTYFILSTNKNIYKYISDDISIYKIKSDNTIKFDKYVIDNLINKYLLLKQYNDNNEDLSLTKYTNKYSKLISINDIDYIYKTLFINNKDKIGEILVNDNIKLINNNEFSNYIKTPYIIYENEEQKLLLSTIIEYIDKYIN